MSLSASQQFHRICQTTNHTQSHQWISSLTSSPSPPTPPRPSPPHPHPLMQPEAAAVAALLRRWSPFDHHAIFTLNANLMTFGKRCRPNVLVHQVPLVNLCAQGPYIPRATPPYPNLAFVRLVFSPLPWLWRLMADTPFLYRYLTSPVSLPVILFQFFFVFDRK